jgi:hypothetical protein
MRGLLAPEGPHSQNSPSAVSSRAPSPLGHPMSEFREDRHSSTLSSPILPPEPRYPARSFLDEISTSYPPAEPAPLANPPPYRSISVTLPSYAPRWQKYNTLPNDLEAWGDGRPGGAVGLRRRATFTKRYPALPKYGWQVWSTIVLITVVTVVSIVIAVIKTAS